jgi:RNA polymerase sigma-70 factor (ECF subfamily)
MTQEEFTYMAGEIRTKAVSIAEKFGYSTDSSEDIAQDVMLRLWSLHEQLSDATNMKSLAIVITKRTCIDRWRTMHHYKEIDDAMLLTDEVTPHGHLEYAELEQWLDKQIESLPSTTGMILRMRQLERRELSEIADILGIKQSSVSTLLSRARSELQNKLLKRNQL